MARVTYKTLLEPYLASAVERHNGDMDMHCPIHGDARRSATVNFKTGEWYCNACEEGGSLRGLIARRAEWLPIPDTAPSSLNGHDDAPPLPDQARLDGWQAALSTNDIAREYLIDKRGLTDDTIRKFGIGWHADRFTFPVYDERGNLVNVRMLSLTKDAKWINWPGAGSPPRLYPMSVFLDDPEMIVVAEGELDTLLAIQNGISAVTSTGGAKSMGRWRSDWATKMSGRQVYICFDCDTEGRQSARKASERLAEVTGRVQIIELPFPMGTKKDLTDFFLEGGTREELFGLAKTGPKKDKKVSYREVHYEALWRGTMEGRPVIIEGTVAGVYSTRLLLPKRLKGTCHEDWDPKKCAHCPMSAQNGSMSIDVENEWKLRLELLGLGSDKTRDKAYRECMGVPANCPQITIRPEHVTAWECEIRNGSNLSEEALPLLLRQDKNPPTLNGLYKFSGRARPSPKGQRMVFDADGATPSKQDLDSFLPAEEDIEHARRWVDSFKGSPDEQIEQIASLLEDKATKIFGQRLLHIAIDLIYHSVLKFQFGGTAPTRGWMELLAVGETRSGKTTAVQKLIDLFGRGHYEPVENATVAGLMYGIEKRASLSGGGTWQSSIGVIPLNDRGLIALDEAQGLDVAQISQMSSMRSDGVVKITKVRQVTCPARVRIIWLANSRKKRYATGIDALQDLMGQAEDLARVDVPIHIKAGEEWHKAKDAYEVLSDDERAVMRWLVLWSWSRTQDQVLWHPKAVEAVWDLAESLSEQFSVADYPVFARNEAHVRLARMATSVAARLFSTQNGVNLLVQPRHVVAAYNLYCRFLGEESLDLTGLQHEEERIKEAGDTLAEDFENILGHSPSEFPQKCAIGHFHMFELRGDWMIHTVNKAIEISAIKVQGDGYLVAPWAQAMAKEYMRK